MLVYNAFHFIISYKAYVFDHNKIINEMVMKKGHGFFYSMKGLIF